MATIVNKAPVFGLASATLVIRDAAGAAVSGYISPNLTDCSLTHTMQVDKTAGQTGDTNMLVGYDEKLELSLSYICQGTTIANAKASGRLPLPLAEVKVSGADVFPVGSFADALNSPADAASGPLWIYEGGGTVELSATGKAIGKMTLHKYLGITGATLPAITT